MGKVIKDTIHAKGVDIDIYTSDFHNEYISLTDIAKYKSEDPTAVIQNWMRSRDVIKFLGLWEILHNSDFNPLEFEGFKNEADMLNVVLFGKTAKQWRDENAGKQGNIRDEATIHQLLVLSNMESYNAILIKQGKTQAERMEMLHELAVCQMATLSNLDIGNLPGIEKNGNNIDMT